MANPVKLRPVTPSDYPFLYELMKEKKPEQNISHKEMPTYEQHVAFNNSKPYGEDYIITITKSVMVPIGIGIVATDTQVPVGRIYLTDRDEVGIHIKEEYASKGYGGEALELILRSAKRPLLANIAPSNTASQAFFTKHGFSLVQHTYRHP